MCHYCGCREIPLIRDYIAEHERATTLGGGALRALEHGDRHTADRLVVEMAGELRSHWRGEENGVFVVMAEADDLYVDYVGTLAAEHRALEAFLERIDLGDPADVQRLRREMADLRDHIAREEDGLFPATLVTLDGPGWNRAMAAWAEAHPDHRPAIG
ncbi:hemerythrin domain-containing protein [Pseudonocardia parietis]|uniref:Iron-sulfur cluster repair protein YtfE (RIC family) n=1 Tax=Pseudonocardia parietis TaxID=570936 RepID=A0ABS4VW88_9PSEU|nr:hemerythrin domain-containing protein [Pseudonocardia parietis]MBP2368181.1 iron-sulfur cluster repair protein YtfE (RIC family) [Pseudonocardia parietis]